MKKKVLLLTSTNLACNPRCLKELKLMLSKNADVTVVGFNLHNWTDQKEKELHEEFTGVHFHCLEGTRHQAGRWLFATFAEKCARFMVRVFTSNTYLSALAVGKRTWLLQDWVKKNTTQFQFVIAHNPPAFYPAAIIATQQSVPFAIDVEDFHPGEGNSPIEKKAVAILMRRLLPLCHYVSFASPLIKTYTENLLRLQPQDKFVVVNNAFPGGEFVQLATSPANGEKIRLVWFSQFIDYHRGIERLLPLLDKFQHDLHLTLIGSMREKFFNSEIKHRHYISGLASVSQKELHLLLNNYDIGLATEDGAVDINRNLCLTNKIWAYFQSGLYLLVTDTPAQQKFLHAHPEHGCTISFSATDAEQVIRGIIKNKVAIRSARQHRFAAASNFSWEREASVLTQHWERILQ